MKGGEDRGYADGMEYEYAPEDDDYDDYLN